MRWWSLSCQRKGSHFIWDLIEVTATYIHRSNDWIKRLETIDGLLKQKVGRIFHADWLWEPCFQHRCHKLCVVPQKYVQHCKLHESWFDSGEVLNLQSLQLDSEHLDWVTDIWCHYHINFERTQCLYWWATTVFNHNALGKFTYQVWG